jgi:hypothetical protein
MRFYLAAFIVGLLATMGLVMAIGPIYNSSSATGYLHSTYPQASSNSVVPNTIGKTPTFIFFNTTTKLVNESVGAMLSIRSPAGYNMTMTILPGTYANVSGKIYSSYNVTLSTFRAFNLASPPSTTDTPKSAFLFKINGNIIQSPAFVNQTGAPHPITFTVNHETNWTSYSYINEQANGTGYTGGSYSGQNKWVYNTTAGTMSDVSLQKAQMHVYELIPAPSQTTTNVTTTKVTTTTAKNTTTTTTPPVTSTNTTTTTTTTTTTPATNTSTTSQTSQNSSSSSSYMIWVVALIVIIVIIAIIYMFMRKKA